MELEKHFFAMSFHLLQNSFLLILIVLHNHRLPFFQNVMLASLSFFRALTLNEPVYSSK
jgi:hypothetical protein